MQKLYICFAIVLGILAAAVSCYADDDYAQAINRIVMKAWQWPIEGRGASTYAIFEIEPTGSVSKLFLHAEGVSATPAEKQIEILIRRCEPFPVPPPSVIAKPWALLIFHNLAGHETLSGPLFKDERAKQLEAMQTYIASDTDIHGKAK